MITDGGENEYILKLTDSAERGGKDLYNKLNNSGSSWFWNSGTFQVPMYNLLK